MEGGKTEGHRPSLCTSNEECPAETPFFVRQVVCAFNVRRTEIVPPETPAISPFAFPRAVPRSDLVCEYHVAHVRDWWNQLGNLDLSRSPGNMSKRCMHRV